MQIGLSLVTVTKKGTFNVEESSSRVGNYCYVDNNVRYTLYQFRFYPSSYHPHAECDRCDLEWVAVTGWSITLK